MYDNQTVLRDARRPENAGAEAASSRFDRIEDRLDSLERMLRELISCRAEPPIGVPSAVLSAPETVPTATCRAAPLSAAPARPWEQTSDDEELDASVREYVERLLKRDEVARNGRSPEPAPTAPSTPPMPPSRAQASSPRPELDDEPAADTRPPVEPAADIKRMAARFEDAPDTAPLPTSLTLPRPHPDHDVNLEAMRMVANVSASAAIRSYEKTQAARKTLDRLPLLLIGVVCGLMLLYTAFSSGAAAMLVGAGVAFLGAALTAWQLLFIFFRWLAASRPVRNP